VVVLRPEVWRLPAGGPRRNELPCAHPGKARIRVELPPPVQLRASYTCNVRWKEYPPALGAIRVVAAIPFFIALLGLGIAYVIMGNMAGRVFGVVLIAAWLCIAIGAARWRFR
jgi:hypothetical protein